MARTKQVARKSTSHPLVISAAANAHDTDDLQPAPRRSSRTPVPRKQLAEDEEDEGEDNGLSTARGNKTATQQPTVRGKAKQTKGKRAKHVKQKTEEEDEEEELAEEDEDGAEEEEEEEKEEEEGGSAGKKKRKTGKAVAVTVKEEDNDAHAKDEEDGEDEHEDDDDDGKKKRKRATTPRTPKRKGKAHLTPLSGDLLDAVRAVVDSQASTLPTLWTRCCPRCSSREAVRAVQLNNLSLLSTVLSSPDVVADPLLPASSTADDALAMAIKQGKVACARLLWQHMQDKVALMRKHRGHYTKSKGWEEEEGEEAEDNDRTAANGDDMNEDDEDHSTSPAAASATTSPTKAKAEPDNKEVLPISRVALPTSTLATLDTGKSNFTAYGHATRKLNASRGGKEGNNAFVNDPPTDTSPDTTVLKAIQTAFQYSSVDMLQMLMQTRHGHDDNYFRPTLPKGAAYLTCHELILGKIRERGVLTAAEGGNVKLVKYMLSLLLGQGDTSAGFNKLHELVCDPKATLPPFRAPSATKKAADNDAITPVHLACISPDTAHLRKLIDVAGPQVLQAEDRQHRKPIHFAAVSATPDALKLLLKYGVSLLDRDRALKTPLDYAVEMGRAHNIPLLIPQPHKPSAQRGESDEAGQSKKGGKGKAKGKKRKAGDDGGEEDEKAEGGGQQLDALMADTADDEASSRRLSKKEQKEQAEAKKLNNLMNDTHAFLNTKDKRTGNTLLHTATKAGHAAAVAALCKAGADPNLADREKLTPVILACQRGSKDCVEALLEATHSQAQKDGADEEAAEGALLLHKDRTGKLGVHFAVMNGHFQLVRLLLEKGVDVNSADSSDNTLLHYAVAYGQSSVAELLMAAGAERSVLSMWRLSPLFIAMLKSHLLCAELLLTGGHVDVNQRDSEGRTLLMHAVASKTDSMEGCLKQVDFLLRQRTQADVHVVDTSKQRTVLHTFAALPYAADQSQDMALLTRLLDAGALSDINRQDSEGYTSLALAIQANNAPIVDMLLENGADKGLRLSESNKSCLMLALELTPPPLPTAGQLVIQPHWNRRQDPDPRVEVRAFNKAIIQRRNFMHWRRRILIALVGKGAYGLSDGEKKKAAKGAGRKGKKAAAESDSAMETTTDSATSEQNVWVAAIDSKGENALFYAARSVVPLEDTLLLLNSPSTKNQLDINIQPHPEKGGGTLLARVLCQQPQSSAVVRPGYREPSDEAEKARVALTEPISHLFRHVQLVHTLISHGADVSVEWRSELPDTEDEKVLKEAKDKQETRTLLMLALQAQPQQLVLPIFTLLCKAKAPLDGLAMPGSRSMLHMLLSKGKQMDLSPFLELIKQRVDSDATDLLALKDEATVVDSSGLTPTLTFWHAALPLPTSANQPKSPSKSPKKADTSQLPVCQYGAKCYRKNPNHLAQFSHPGRNEADDDDDGGNDGAENEDDEDDGMHEDNDEPTLDSAALSTLTGDAMATATARTRVSTMPGYLHHFAAALVPQSVQSLVPRAMMVSLSAASTTAQSMFGALFNGASAPAAEVSSSTGKWVELDDSSAPVDIQVATSLLPSTPVTQAFVLSAGRLFGQMEVWHSLVGLHISDTVQKSDEAKKDEKKKRKEQKKRDKQRGTSHKHDDSSSPQAELDTLHNLLSHPPTQKNLSCTALHLAVLAGDVQAVQWLVRHGADVLAGDWFARTPLLLSVKDSSRVDIPQALLVERAPEQTSAVDALGVTPLMAAVAYSASHSSDSTREFVESFAVESLLMKHTRDLNRTDKLGRSVVHYVFCPLYERHTNGAAGDPIELLADLVAAASNPSNAASAASASLSSSSSSPSSNSALLLDTPDVYQRTPLHYCSEIGAQICLKYLVARGADPKRIDADGNGAFQLALLHDHRGYCVDLVDKGVDIARPIVKTLHQRKHHHQPAPPPPQLQGPAQPQPNQPQYPNFGMRLRTLQPPPQLLNQPAAQPDTTSAATQHTTDEPKKLATFEYVLRKNWSGLAYLMMDAGIPLTVAVRDALATDRFQLVVTLVKKVGGEQIHTVDAETGRNVLHAIADYRPSSHDCAHHFNTTWSAKTYEALQQLGLNVGTAAAARTKKGKLPLHFAAAHNHLQLMDALLAAYPAGLDALDGNQKTPLHYAAEGGHLRAVHLLCKRGAKLDWPTAAIFAPSKPAADSVSTSGRSEESLLDDRYSFPPLVSAARRNHYFVVELLLLFGANPNVSDNRGRTILMRAVSLNDNRLARLALHSPHSHPPDIKPSPAKKLAPTKPKLKASNVNTQDTEGNTALHLLVVPNGQYEPGYENAALLNEVVQLAQQKLAGSEHNVKCKWDVQNKLGHTAAYYAAQQSSGVMLKALTDLKVSVQAAILTKANADRAQWDKQHLPDSFAYDANTQLDVDKDTAALKQYISAKQLLEATKDDDSDTATVPVDEEKFAKTYTVLMDDTDPANPQPFDVMLTFTDTSGRHNRFGTHSFYKIQLLYNQPQDLYLLWNRWGRVGTRGEYQQTPQTDRVAAVKQFKSIFKSKTANTWEQRSPEAFTTKPGKYVIDRSRVSGKAKADSEQGEEGEAAVVSLQSLMAEYGKQLPPSTLPAPLQTLIAAICDLSSIQALAKRLGVETTKALPLGELTDEQVQQGKAILSQLSDKVEEYTQAQSELGQVMSKLNEVNVNESQLNMEHSQQQQQQQAGDDMKDDQKSEQREPSEELKKVQAQREQLQAELQRRNETKSALESELTSLSNSYYTVVPSSQYVNSAISAIRSKEQLRKEQYNLSQMIDLHVATKILMGARASVIRLLSNSSTASSSSSSSTAVDALARINRALSDLSSTGRLNPIDYCYQALRVDLRLLEHDSSEFKRLRQYMHASTPDSGSSQQWELYDIFALRRQGEEQRFNQYSHDIPNHQLLWHGSGMGNFAGLLTQGLCIAPPEAQASGYMFGKGVYFADQFNKSIAYCQDWNLFNNNTYMRYRQQQEQQHSKRSYCILLAQVALGNVYKAYESEYMDEARPGHHCTLGVGRRQPDRTQQLVTTEGVIIPSGPLVPTELDGKQPTLENNEWIVYKEQQACLRYIVRVGPPRPKRTAREVEKERTEVQWRENEEDEDDGDDDKDEEGDGTDQPAQQVDAVDESADGGDDDEEKAEVDEEAVNDHDDLDDV